MIKRRLPFQPLQKATCDLLKECQTAPVYEYVTTNTKPPYITFGEIDILNESAKGMTLYTAGMDIHAYSRAHTRREVNEMLDDIATILSSALVDLSADKYQVIDQDVGESHTSPSETEGYGGIIRINFTIQDMEE